MLTERVGRSRSSGLAPTLVAAFAIGDERSSELRQGDPDLAGLSGFTHGSHY